MLYNIFLIVELLFFPFFFSNISLLTFQTFSICLVFSVHSSRQKLFLGNFYFASFGEIFDVCDRPFDMISVVLSWKDFCCTFFVFWLRLRDRFPQKLSRCIPISQFQTPILHSLRFLSVLSLLSSALKKNCGFRFG